VREPVLGRALKYWKRIDAGVGQRIEDKVRAGVAPKATQGMGLQKVSAKADDRWPPCFSKPCGHRPASCRWR
jgi:hypothetical protein